MRIIFAIAALFLAVRPAFSETGQVYSCTLHYSVSAKGGKIEGWGKWQSLFEDGPGEKMAAAYGTIIIDTRPEAPAPVRTFGIPSPFKWKVIQKGGAGNSWVLFGEVFQELQGRGGSSWAQIISVADFDWRHGVGTDAKAAIPITFFDQLDTLYTGLCRRV